ncbi:chloramphenicol phosphotransferase CPT family protein [Labedaea rhizosphaerae]|uniref:Chloramphenicol 3-O phosphotransferase n=1 Tax=Labedaea rhizosphaerae TaxID=598644 RepID=A0A4R6SEK4_LABRH|nr:AAA family ATPase [Labedaea rhizosphaerae]TDP97565.1 chloramphenicol 3-O phosphotransferase [Labedaea rhizosphaerae]
MLTQVIVLNGGSSSGKSTIARALQDRLPEPWLSLSVDMLVEAMPGEGIAISEDGDVTPDDTFGRLERAWMTGVAAMVRAGAKVIIDDVFLSGRESQDRWRQALAGLAVLWVGVHCDAVTAEARELARGDRIAGMAAKQAETVHDGVHYDLEVDTTDTDATTCAELITARLVTQPK